MIRIGIVGCGRILNAHLHGYRLLREAGFDDFRITALCARNRDDALMFRKRGRGAAPAPRRAVAGDGRPVGRAPHIYLDEFQPDTDAAVFTDYREMIAAGTVDAVNDFTTLSIAPPDRARPRSMPVCICWRRSRWRFRWAAATPAGGQGEGKGADARSVRECAPSGVHAAPPPGAIRQGLIGALQLALFGGIGGLWSPDKIVAETPWRHHKLGRGRRRRHRHRRAYHAHGPLCVRRGRCGQRHGADIRAAALPAMAIRRPARR